MDRHHIILVFLGILLTQCSNHVVRCLQRDVRLVGGPTPNKGTVEISVDGEAWETTCGRNIGITEVFVICIQLGFKGASIAITDTPYEKNSNPTKGLSCAGGEVGVSKCTLLPLPMGCSTAGAASCHGKGYLGCFRDEHNRVLPGDKLIGSPDMTISYCIQFCNKSTTANYTYAGVENGDECYCGEASDDYTRHGDGPDDACLFPCAGDPTESCGGSGYLTVFNMTIQPSSEMTSHTRDAVTSTTLHQSGHSSCVVVAVGEGVVIIFLIATNIVSVMYILRIRKKMYKIHTI